MGRMGPAVTLLLAGFFLAGCGGLGNVGGQRVSSLPPSPTEPVAQRPLGPMTLEPDQQQGTEAEGEGEQNQEETAEEGTEDESGTSAEGLAEGQTPEEGTAVAALSTPPPDADSSVKLGRADLLGGWQLASGAESCQLFMNLTSWQGGYRATTRGCSSPALQNISAWDLNGQQVTLKDGNGAAIGTVFPTGSGQFAGQTAGGQRLAFSR
ncbi:MAG: protease inhibitor Inh/omp19 family protein [Pseudomonadota bacterium]